MSKDKATLTKDTELIAEVPVKIPRHIQRNMKEMAKTAKVLDKLWNKPLTKQRKAKEK